MSEHWHANCDDCSMSSEASGDLMGGLLGTLCEGHANRTGHTVSLWRRGRRDEATKIEPETNE